MPADIGLVGLAVMGQVGEACKFTHDTVPRLAAKELRSRLLQNLALNVADKGFTISVFNRTYAKTEKAVARAKKEGKAV